jgi:hypothetical protein
MHDVIPIAAHTLTNKPRPPHPTLQRTSPNPRLCRLQESKQRVTQPR